MRILRTILVLAIGIAIGLLATLFHRGAAVDAEPANDFAMGEPLPDVLVDVDYNGTPAPDALADLAAKAKVNLRIDRRALDTAGIDARKPIHLRLKHAPLSAAFNQVLHEYGTRTLLEWRLNQNVLTVSTAEALQQNPIVRVYEVGDLIAEEEEAFKSDPNTVGDIQQMSMVELEKQVEDLIAPDTWRDTAGQLATLQTWGGRSLIIMQTPENQELIAQFLQRMRRPTNTVPPSQHIREAGFFWLADDMAMEPIPAAVVDAKYDGVPAPVALAHLAAQAKLNLIIDQPALEAVGLEANTPVHIRLSHVPLSTALVAVLSEYGGKTRLGCRLDRGILTVTTADALECCTVFRVYDVDDLVQTELLAMRTRFPNESAWTRQEAMDDLIKLIEDMVATNSYRGNGFGTICSWGNRRLAVVQLPENHREIARLLQNLRNPDVTAPQPADSPLFGASDADPPVIYIYDVADLVQQAAAKGESKQANTKLDALDTLAQTIQDNVDPKTWRDGGGDGAAIHAWGDHLLVVSMTSAGHQKLAKFLQHMRHPQATIPGTH